jgi:hypothetical protein
VRRRDYVGASYGGPRSKGRSATRLARYIGDREGAKTFGDREAFLEEARARALENRRASYAHIIVAPERGEHFNDRDLKRLTEPFIKDRDGNECPCYGAIHRDTDNAHVHIAVARDKFEKRELTKLKEEVRDLVSSRERLREGPWQEAVGARDLFIEREISERDTGHEREIRGQELEAEREIER